MLVSAAVTNLYTGHTWFGVQMALLSATSSIVIFVVWRREVIRIALDSDDASVYSPVKRNRLRGSYRYE